MKIPINNLLFCNSCFAKIISHPSKTVIKLPSLILQNKLLKSLMKYENVSCIFSNIFQSFTRQWPTFQNAVDVYWYYITETFSLQNVIQISEVATRPVFSVKSYTSPIKCLCIFARSSLWLMMVAWNDDVGKKSHLRSVMLLLEMQ